MKIPIPVYTYKGQNTYIHTSMTWWDVGKPVRRLIRWLFLRDLEERTARRLERVKRTTHELERQAGLAFYGVFMAPGYWRYWEYYGDGYVRPEGTRTRERRVSETNELSEWPGE